MPLVSNTVDMKNRHEIRAACQPRTAHAVLEPNIHAVQIDARASGYSHDSRLRARRMCPDGLAVSEFGVEGVRHEQVPR